MNTDATGAVLAAVLNALTLVQGQLDTVVRGNARIEASQNDILTRLDTIDAGQAAVTDLVPVLEMILARSIEDRELTRAQLSTVAAIAGFAHAAASGTPAPLPVDIADDRTVLFGGSASDAVLALDGQQVFQDAPFRFDKIAWLRPASNKQP